MSSDALQSKKLSLVCILLFNLLMSYVLVQRGPSVELGPHSCSSYILHIIIHTQNLFVCGQNSFRMIQSCQETVFSLCFSYQLVHLMFCVQRGPSVELGPRRGAGSPAWSSSLLLYCTYCTYTVYTEGPQRGAPHSRFTYILHIHCIYTQNLCVDKIHFE